MLFSRRRPTVRGAVLELPNGRFVLLVHRELRQGPAKQRAHQALDGVHDQGFEQGHEMRNHDIQGHGQDNGAADAGVPTSLK